MAAAAQLMTQMIQCHVLGATPKKIVESGVIVIIINFSDTVTVDLGILLLTPFYNVCPCDTSTCTCTCNYYSCVHAFVGNDCFCETDFTRPGIWTISIHSLLMILVRSVHPPAHIVTVIKILHGLQRS